MLIILLASLYTYFINSTSSIRVVFTIASNVVECQYARCDHHSVRAVKLLAADTLAEHARRLYMHRTDNMCRLCACCQLPALLLKVNAVNITGDSATAMLRRLFSRHGYTKVCASTTVTTTSYIVK
jgi:hypothetical protein